MDVPDSPHILSDDRIVTVIRAITHLAFVRALDVRTLKGCFEVKQSTEKSPS